MKMDWKEILSSILMWISAICVGIALVFMSWLSELATVVLAFVGIFGLVISIFLITIDY